MRIVLAYITNPTRREARNIANLLLRKHLIACANIFKTNSLYPWKGKLVDGEEHVLLVKTTSKKFNAMRREVERVHSYKVPCILRVPADANPAFAKWTEDVLRS